MINPREFLTPEEFREMGDRIARGEVRPLVPDDPEEDEDAVDLTLASGRRIRGRYRWAGSPEWVEFTIDRVKGELEGEA
jgi:hypothetical protein